MVRSFLKSPRADNKNGADKKGFTLIELSIVLVIIGLIVGGILVGQDLIKGAEIRATIAQIEKYNTAVNTFRNKYGGIPGDLTVSTASQFGLFSTLSGSSYYGDGNGLVEGGASTTAAGGVTGEGETLVFWRHLSDASLVDGSFGSGATIGSGTGALATACTSAGACNSYIPAAKLGRGNSIIINAAQGLNYFGITGVTDITTAGAITGTNNLTPIEAFNIDKKVDDSLPYSGSVQAFDAGTFGTNFVTVPATSGTASSGCALSASSAYNVTASGNAGTTQACSLRMRFN